MRYRIVVIMLIVLTLLTLLFFPARADSTTNKLLKPGDELALTVFDSGIGSIDWSPDGSLIALTLTLGAKLELVRPDGAVVTELPLPSGGGPVEWRPGTNLMAVGAGSRLLLISETGVKTMDRDMERHINALAWSDDGELLAVGLEDGTIAYFNLVLGVWRQYVYSGAAITSIDWSHDKKYLIWGDSLGRVRVLDLYNLTLTTDYKVSNTPITSLRVNPSRDIVAFSVENATFIASFNNGNLTVYTQAPYGTVGNLEWSPNGDRLIVPTDTGAVVLDVESDVKATISMANIYPYRLASWDPTSYSRVAFAGYNAVYRKGGLEVIYSGSFVSITSNYPVLNVCYQQICGSTISFSPWSQNVNVTLTVEAEAPGKGIITANATVTLKLEPFTQLFYNAYSLLTNNSLNRHVESEGSLIMILHDPRAMVEVKNESTVINITSQAVLLPPRTYEFTVYYESPENYLGPGSLLKKNFLVKAIPGQILVYNLTWFKLEDLVANLDVTTVENATLSILYNDTRNSTIVDSNHATYKVPAGKLTISLQLPSNNVIVGDEKLLSKTINVILYPGDTLQISYDYNDILGKLVFKGPSGAMLVITPPWSTPYHPALVNITLTGTPVMFWASPGTYVVEAYVKLPENYIGPMIPPARMNATVVKGQTTWVDLYSEGNITQALSILERAAYLRIEASPGYVVSILYGNQSLKYNMSTGEILLVVPPGNYTINLIDPEKKAVVNTKQLIVSGPGNITLSIQPTVPETTTTTTTIFSATQKEKPSYMKLLIPIVTIPVLIVIVAILMLRRMRPTL